MNNRLPRLLTDRIGRGLSGPLVGSRFDLPAGTRRGYDDPAPNARQAAVLLLLYPHQGRWHLPLTVRRDDLPDHPGQVCLPGGSMEPGETCRQAEVREFHEELGTAGHPIELLGRLSPHYVDASNFQIFPWVGATMLRPEFDPNPAEVAELLEVPLAHLLDPINFATHQRPVTEGTVTTPHFAWDPHRIWGATCMILEQLLHVLEDLPS